MKNKELGMKKLIKKALKLILPLVLGGFILYWVYRDFDFVKATEVLQHGTNWWWMAFSLLFGIFAQVFREGIVLMPYSFRMQLVWLYRG